MIDREPITVVCSQMGWVRAMTGHIDLAREIPEALKPRRIAIAKPGTPAVEKDVVDAQAVN